MKKFSRWMPLSEQPPIGVVGWTVLAGLAAGFLALIIAAPIPVGLTLFALWMSEIAGKLTGDRYNRRLASERKGEDIGTFARAFDRRSEPFDPWVVRATWDALQPYVGFPLRPMDRLVEDLCIDEQEIDMALLGEIAERSGHLLDNLEENPYFEKFSTLRNVTVGDFAKLISGQPRTEADTRRRTKRP